MCHFKGVTFGKKEKNNLEQKEPEKFSQTFVYKLLCYALSSCGEA